MPVKAVEGGNAGKEHYRFARAAYGNFFTLSPYKAVGDYFYSASEKYAPVFRLVKVCFAGALIVYYIFSRAFALKPEYIAFGFYSRFKLAVYFNGESRGRRAFKADRNHLMRVGGKKFSSVIRTVLCIFNPGNGGAYIKVTAVFFRFFTVCVKFKNQISQGQIGLTPGAQEVAFNLFTGCVVIALQGQLSRFFKAFGGAFPYGVLRLSRP